MSSLKTLSLLAGFLILADMSSAQNPLNLELSTDNIAIFSSDPSDFYMYTNRTFEGVSSKPWTGGKYGFVRNAKRTSSGIVMTRFHEGVDIRPARRSSTGEPLDDVRPVSPGRVMHVNATSGHSSYGKYVVVEHQWSDGPFYSLYAHLNTTTVKPGQEVTHQSVLGKLGHTGAGINKERAHLHLEINLYLNSRFETWHGQHFRSSNYHGTFNGLNLVGLDVAGLFKSHRADKGITISGFMSRMDPYYTVRVVNRGTPEILKRYPFLGANMSLARGNPSWDITFSSSGVPLKIAPSRDAVSTASVIWVKPSNTYHAYNTRSRLSGTGSNAALTSSGESYIKLVTGQF